MTGQLTTGSGLPFTPVYLAPVPAPASSGRCVRVSRARRPTPAAGLLPESRRVHARRRPDNGATRRATPSAGPAQFSFDAGVARTFQLTPRLTLDWRIDATNVLNRETYTGVNAVFGSPQFGLPSQANTPRKIVSTTATEVLDMRSRDAHECRLVPALAALRRDGRGRAARRRAADRRHGARAEPRRRFARRRGSIVQTVSVKDKDGQPVEGLTPNDFIVTEDGEPQTVSFAEFQRLPAPCRDAARRRRSAPRRGNAARRTGADGRVASTTPTQIATSAPGEIRYRNRRLLVLYFDLTAMPPDDQLRAYNGARKFIDDPDDARRPRRVMTFQGGAVRVKQDFTGDKDAAARRRSDADLRRRRGRRRHARPRPTGTAFGQDDAEFQHLQHRPAAVGAADRGRDAAAAARAEGAAVTSRAACS